MYFNEFIKNLSVGDKENFELYSKTRGHQIYKIIFEELEKVDKNVTYKDVNAFVINDKALKDNLYKYLGTLEEGIKTFIFNNFDFSDEYKGKGEGFKNYNKKSKLIKKIIENFDITELYNEFKLPFGDIIKLLKDFDIKEFCFPKLDEIKILRDRVMHHLPILFDVNGSSIQKDTLSQIYALRDMLPDEYKENFIKSLEDCVNKTRENIAKPYYKFLLFKEE